MKQKYIPAAIIFTSIGVTLLIASSFDTKANISGTNITDNTDIGGVIDENLNDPIDGNIDDFGDPFGDAFADPSFNEIAPTIDTIPSTASDTPSIPDTTIDTIPTPTQTPTTPPITNNVNTKPVFYRNGKVVEVNFMPSAPEVPEPIIDEPIIQTGSTVELNTNSENSEIDNSNAESGTTIVSTENNDTSNTNSDQKDLSSSRKGASMFLIGSIISIIFLSIILIFWLIKRKHKLPKKEIHKITGEIVDLKPKQKFAQVESNRLNTVLTSLDDNNIKVPQDKGDKIISKGITPNQILNKDAVLPVNPLPPELKEKTSINETSKSVITQSEKQTSTELEENKNILKTEKNPKSSDLSSLQEKSPQEPNIASKQPEN